MEANMGELIKGIILGFFELLRIGIVGFGGLLIIWGGIIIGTAFKDKSGPAFMQGVGVLVGGIIIALCGVFVTKIGAAFASLF